MATISSSSASRDRTAFNRERAKRRRSVLATVQEQRERLSFGNNTPRGFNHELALTYARNRASASYAIALLILLVAGASLAWIELHFAAAWAAIALAAQTLTVFFCRRFLSLAPKDAPFEAWRNRFVAVEFLTGLSWSLLFVLTEFSNHAPGLDTFQFATMLIVVSVTTSLASTVPAAAVVGSAPVTLALVAAFMFHGGVLHIALAVMAAAAQVFFLLLSTRLHSATLNMLEFRAQKDMLIAELSTAKAISDEARRRAEEANLAKSRFLATMSHELRTPLNAIIGFSEIISKEVLGPVENDTYKEYVGDIHNSGQYLLNLINEILDLSRIEAGKYELNEEALYLGEVVSDCSRLVQMKAQGKDIELVVTIEPDLERIWADQRAVRQIALNLLSNALKFTPTGGKVELIVESTPEGGQRFTVSDNGPGIPEDEIPIVLSSFGQGSVALNSGERGAGLGLTIVQALMDTHDGTFELESKLRVGTKVCVTFPESRVMEALPPVSDEDLRRYA